MTLQVQVNTGNHIAGSEDLEQYVESVVTDAIEPYIDWLTRIEAHLADENSTKGGERDKRCTLEFRLKGRNPEVVSHEAENMRKAIDGASEKLRRSLRTMVGRIRDRR